MEYIEEEYNRIINQKAIFDDIIEQSVIEIADYIRKTIKGRWSSGYSVNGGKITNKATGGGYSSKSYKNLKIQMNPKAGGGVDLTFTGALGDGINVVKSNNDYEIISEDSKFYEIGTKYGFDEFGLSEAETIFYMNILEVKINTKLLNL